MRFVIGSLLIISFSACKETPADNRLFQSQIDSLEKRLEETYKPGLGEFMSALQAHHAKLWYSGNANNWPLATFEIKEMGEIVEDIRTYASDRTETSKVNQLEPYMDSVMQSISQKNAPLFKRSYTALTAACNNCHKEVSFDFNVVQVPSGNSFPNQDFSLPHPLK